MCHPRYCLTHQPGFSSNITNAIHFSTPDTPTTLVHHPLSPRWCTTYGTHTGTSPQHPVHTTHASTSSTLARYPRLHATNANTPPTLACLPRKHVTRSTHDSTHSVLFLKTPGYSIKLLKLLCLKFREEIQQFLLFIFIVTAFTFQAFLSIFIEVWKTTIEKLNFFRGNQSALFIMWNFFRKNCFLIVSQQFTENELPLLSILNERRSFIFRSSHPQVFYKKVSHKILSKFTCNLIKEETPTQVYFCEVL